MVKSLRYLFLMIFISFSGAAFAQSGGISGKVFDETKQPVIGAIVEVSQGGSVRGGAATDEEGSYTIKPLNPATDYVVTVKYTGYQEIRMDKVQITADRTTYQNFNMQVASNVREEVMVIEYIVPLIKKDEPGTSTTFTGDDIKNMATINTNDVAALSGGTYQQKSGSGVSIGGARTNGTLYIIDGIQVSDAAVTNLPPGSIDQMSVITSGLPAKYGDALGGVISITTRGASPEHRGDVRLEHSVDGYNHNLASFNFTGPILKKKMDSVGVNKRTLLGYALGAQYLYDVDDNPNYFDNYVVKQSVLDEIRQRPFIQTGTSSGQELRYATEDITMNDLETSKRRINAESQTARANGRLDLQLSENANLSAGGNFTYNNQRNYSKFYSLFAPEAIPNYKSNTTRAFLRYTQKLGNSKASFDEESQNKSLISNAYYSVQADYQRDYAESEDKDHKKNPFYYNYIGKYDIKYTPIYAFGYDSVSGINMIRLETNRNPSGVTFERSDRNPYLANYTSQVYDFLDGNVSSLDELSQQRGLLNGQIPSDVIGSNVFANVGRGLTGYSYSNREQFAFQVDANFDLQLGKTKHAIGFGMYYQQRSERFFGFGRPSTSVSIWNAMRLLANQHLISLDYHTPTYIRNGQSYTWEEMQQNGMTPGPTDTVVYQNRFDEGSQSTFSKNLRKKLAELGIDNGGVNGNSYLNVDALDPSLFSLDMFSADELLNQGENFVNYYGYDFTGKRLNGQVTFNDWFTKKDANGNYTRNVGAFRPNYTAGYIMDKFEFGSGTLFNVGVRVERFDANTKVLKDPYSLYAVNTVATSDAKNLYNNGTPGNMGSDYVVYVADNTAENPQVVGYRNGDDWYDPYGRPLADPSDIQRLYSDGRAPQPYLQRNNDPANPTRALTMRDEGYDPNSSFTDYKPQVNVMPRLSFSFPIAEQSMFYAHYDVVVQRPKSVAQIYATPGDYYNIVQNSSAIIGNPDLKPEKMFDYEIGFQQQLNKSSAVTLTGFYKERKDMIQVRPYLYAWPTTYYTYGNRDFSTTKGFIFKYDLRRTNHLMMFATYTLQFAEGTGSSAAESNGGRSDVVATGGLLQNLIGASLPNLRFAYPLSVDSRHNINVNIDYRYDKGEGPIVGKYHILENAGLNLIFRTRSGEPYTRYINAIPGNTTIIGGVQNARMPWHYMFDLRFDKQFDIYLSKKNPEADGMRERKSLGMMAFVYISNLLNTRDVLGVYRYTGRPDDNGYLVSANGQQAASTQYNPQSYYDLYTIDNQNPGYLNNPRRINIGLQFNF